MSERLAGTPADVESRHVVDGEHAHRHAEVRERAIDLARRRALFDEILRFVHVGEHQAIADEARSVADNDAQFLQACGRT